jgi:hypothetical protein
MKFSKKSGPYQLQKIILISEPLSWAYKEMMISSQMVFFIKVLAILLKLTEEKQALKIASSHQ